LCYNSAMVQNLIILGPQGSGKGTQAKLLCGKFGFAYVGSGDTLREMAKKDSELGRKVRSCLEAGQLVPDEIVMPVLEEKLRTVPSGQPVLIEGFVRRLPQYEFFKKIWPRLRRGDFKVLFIELSEDEAVKRLAARSGIENRDDDKPEAIKRRLEWFRRETLPMLEAMKRDGVEVIRIDGSPSIEMVHKEILQKLGMDSRLRGNDNT